jgi:antitoxin component of MazEF toxin-antitoxin module
MIIAKTRKWGNSLGIVLPSDAVRELKISENEEVILEIRKKQSPLRELYGSCKENKITRAEFEEFRKNDSKWL